MLYSILRVIPLCLNFVCRRFGMHSLFHLQLTFGKAAQVGGRQQSQASDILTSPQGTTSDQKDLERNGHQPE